MKKIFLGLIVLAGICMAADISDEEVIKVMDEKTRHYFNTYNYVALANMNRLQCAFELNIINRTFTNTEFRDYITRVAKDDGTIKLYIEFYTFIIRLSYNNMLGDKGLFFDKQRACLKSIYHERLKIREVDKNWVNNTVLKYFDSMEGKMWKEKMTRQGMSEFELIRLVENYYYVNRTEEIELTPKDKL